MLERRHRLTSGRLFDAAVRRGRRAGTATLVVHLARVPPTAEDSPGPRVGFVVGRRVGNAVDRNRVKRRLRHLVRGRLAELSDGALLVVRALPPAATAETPTLARDLDGALARLTGRPGR